MDVFSSQPEERKDLFPRPTAVKTRNSPLTSDVNTAFRTILEHLKKAMSVCSLKAKLSFKDYTVSVNKPCEFVELVKCCLILDAERRQVKFKIHKGVAISAINACIPPPVKKAKSVIRTAIERIPLQNQTAITKLFSAIFKVLATKQDRDYVTMSQDDIIDNDMSFKQLMSSNKLYSTLLALDLKILCSKGVVVEFKRRQILGGIRRRRVVLDSTQGLQIFKEPRVFMRSEEVQVALVTLAKWVSSQQQFGLWQNVLEVVKCLQAVRNYRGKH